jgi:hypothetical protein
MAVSNVSHSLFTDWCRVASLSAASFVTGGAIFDTSAFAQERAFALLHEQIHKLKPSLEPAESAGLRSRFERQIESDPSRIDDLRKALDEPTTLRIVHGVVTRRFCPENCEFTLYDGSLLSIAPSGMPEIIFGGRDPLMVQTPAQEVSMPCSAIRSVRPKPDIRYDLAWRALRDGKPSVDDVLAIRLPNGALDELHGVARSCSATHIMFEFEEQPYRVNLEKVEGILLAKGRLQSLTRSEQPTALLETSTQQLACSQVSLSEDTDPRLLVTTPSGVRCKLALVPFILDRSALHALTLHRMQITSRRTPGFDVDILERPLAERLLSLPPTITEISGKGLTAALTIRGPAEVEMTVPHGYRTLLIDPIFALDAPASFTLSYKGRGEHTESLYTQERFTPPNGGHSIREEISLPGEGTLSVHVPPGNMRFRLFMVMP